MPHASHWPSTQGSLLVRLCSPSDKEAWQTFVQLYLPLVYQYCRRKGLQDADARDVSQNVFTQVSRAIGRFDYDRQRGRFRNWLGTITFREIVHHHRREQKSTPGMGDGLGDQCLNELPAPEATDWNDAFYLHVFRVAVTRVRSLFDEPTWQAFELTWQQDCRPADVAQQMQKSAAWVYRAKFRVLSRITKEIEYLAEDVAAFNQ